MRNLDVVIATRNPNKLRELKALLAIPEIRWRSLADFPHVPALREDGRTFSRNAVWKARAVARATGRLALADDSGLEVAALGGAPGVHSARFAGRHGDDGANNAKLLRLLERVPPTKRRARFRCALALAGPEGFLAVTEGTLAGRIAREPRGRGGFGYDPLFLLPGLHKTLAQISAAAKHRISHRGRASKRMRKVLERMLRTPGKCA